MAIVKAMLKTGILPDYIVVDGAEGGTGAAPLEFTDHLGMPMRESLLFVHNTLVGAGLRHKIKLGAAGKIVSAFDIATAMALGADWTNAGRGFMRSEEHTSELQSLMRISYAVFCLKKKTKTTRY